MGAAHSEPPAVARQRVRRALRKARRAAGLIQGDVAARLGWSLSKVQRIESGEVGVSETDLRALLDLYGIEDGSEVASLVADAKTSRRQRWWIPPAYREHVPAGLRQLLQFEAEASVIRAYQPFLIPGLLQTPAMADYLLGWFDRSLTDEDRRVRFEVRMHRRRQIVEREVPPSYRLMLDEAVIKRETGGPEVMAGQLELLVQLARLPAIHVRIMPLSVGGPVGLLGPFVVLDLSDDDNEDAVLYRETYTSDSISSDAPTVALYRSRFESLWPQCFDENQSMELIAAEATALRAALIRVPSTRNGRVDPQGQRVAEHDERFGDPT